MTIPIYKLYIVHGFREAYYQLSTAERDQFWARLSESNKAGEAKHLLICNSRWCNEAYSAWGIEEYPDLRAVQKTSQLHEDSQNFRYLETETCLGTKLERFQTGSVHFPDPLYQLVLFKNHNNEAMHGLLNPERDHYTARVVEMIQKNGGVLMLLCDCDWSSTEITNFALIAWPNLEAEKAYFTDLAEIDFHRYFYIKTILGTLLE